MRGLDLPPVPLVFTLTLPAWKKMFSSLPFWNSIRVYLEKQNKITSKKRKEKKPSMGFKILFH